MKEDKSKDFNDANEDDEERKSQCKTCKKVSANSEDFCLALQKIKFHASLKI